MAYTPALKLEQMGRSPMDGSVPPTQAAGRWGRGMTLPNFLCIGAQKAGTGWLYQMIQQHPNVWVPPVKEVHFFDYMYVKSNRLRTERFLKGAVQKCMLQHINRYMAKGVDFSYLRYLTDIASHEMFTEAWYRRIFERPNARGKVVGELSPAYCTIPQEGIRHLRRLISDARLIYIIRDPTDRALSQLRMEALRPRRKPPANEQDWLERAEQAEVTKGSDYAHFIPLWQAAFPSPRLLFVPYGDIAAEPTSALRKIESFLELKPYAGYKGLNTKIHATTTAAIPNSVTDLIATRLSKQKDFLKSAFGEDFVARTRG